MEWGSVACASTEDSATTECRLFCDAHVISRGVQRTSRDGDREKYRRAGRLRVS